MFRLICGMLLWASVASSQQIAEGVYWVYFTDKNVNGYTLDQPEMFLSERSVHRRAWQGLSVDHWDLPVTQTYVDEISALGAEIKHISKWLNGIAIIDADSVLFKEILDKPFTTTTAWKPEDTDQYVPPAPTGSRFALPLEESPDYHYGVATEQITMLSVDRLHDLGYTGNGVWIAVLDAGFRDADLLPSFQSMISEGRLLNTRNFVREVDVFRENSAHGMYVLSIMGGEWDGNMVGSAPHAGYMLCTTENVDQETRIEEIAWVEAAEYADSLGFDVINTSLGYSDFNGTDFDYTYLQMDGKSTFISKAASLTASRGMICCNSAGNSGNDPWYYITAPADASDILAVGAVDSSQFIGYFSSRGPSFDGRIKPEVVTMGVASGVQSLNGGVARGNGTSFASPVLAGSVASLWQACPEIPAKELIQKILQSSDRYNNPGADYGFGLPDFTMAYGSISHVAPGEMIIYPNPAQSHIMIRLSEDVTGHHHLKMYDLSGRMVLSREIDIPGSILLPATLQPGVFILEVKTEHTLYRNWIIKE